MTYPDGGDITPGNESIEPYPWPNDHPGETDNDCTGG